MTAAPTPDQRPAEVSQAVEELEGKVFDGDSLVSDRISRDGEFALIDPCIWREQ